MSRKRVIHVAVAVIEDEAGRVLLARRHEDAHQGGLWEFPGGKLDPGESLEQALARECLEELGIELDGHRPLIRITHHYPDLSVLLDVHKVSRFRGEARGMEGQPLAWVEPGALDRYAMPAADRPIVNAIRLPSLYLVTPARVEDPGVFLEDLARSLDGRVALVQLRVTGVPELQLEALAMQAMEVCAEKGAAMLVNADVGLAQRIGAAGVHLKGHQLLELTERPQGLEWVAASCHSAADLDRAADLGLDFAVLSPVMPTASHADAVPLGWQGFRALSDEASIPVYALGGMTEDDLAAAWQAGAQGVAAIRGLWRDGAGS